MKSRQLIMVLCVAGVVQGFCAGVEEQPAALSKLGLGKYGRLCDRKTFVPLNLGPTGAVGWPIGREILVTSVQKGSPAAGILQEDDIIVAANGRMLEQDPRRTLGKAVTESEAAARGGKLELMVLRGGEKKELTVILPVLGEYSATWPADCRKSAKVLHNACEWLAERQQADGLFQICGGTDGYTPTCINGMLFLASGDARYIENARRLAYNLVRNRVPRPSSTVALENWAWSYSAVFLCEYYLATGDGNVLPYIRELQDWIAKGQVDCGSWSYGPRSEEGGRVQNQVALTCFLALVLAKECGVDANEEALENATRFFERFVDNESIGYGDHRPWADVVGNGRDGQAAVIFRLLGGHRASSAYFAQRIADAYPWFEKGHTGPFFSVFWGPMGASLARDEWFRKFIDHWQWYYDLSRTWDGGFWIPDADCTGNSDQYTLRGPVFTTGGMGLVYGLGEKRLQIQGARPGVFSRVKLPRRLDRARKLFAEKKWAEAGSLADGVAGSARADEKRYALQLAGAARLMEQTVSLTLAEIERNIKENNPAPARVQIDDLRLLLGRDDVRLAGFEAQLGSVESRRALEAVRMFESNQFLCVADAGARKKMKELADDAGIGAVRKKAAAVLELCRAWPSYRDYPPAEIKLDIFSGRWSRNRADAEALSVMNELAHIPGQFWVPVEVQKQLEKAGQWKEDGLWESLAGLLENCPDRWRYLYPAAGEAVAGWYKADFDDSSWQKGSRLFEGDGNWDMKAARMIVRTKFELKTVNYDRIFLYARCDTPADVYLNGELVGRFLKDTTARYETFKLSGAALSLLREGTNVLAVAGEHKDGNVVLSVSLKGIRADRSGGANVQY